MKYRVKIRRTEGLEVRPEAEQIDGKVMANRERTFLLESFQLQVIRGNLKENPVRYLKRFKEKPRSKYVTDEEFTAVFNVAPPIVRAAMLLAVVTGLRQVAKNPVST